jgi:hypothetical protein
LVEKPIQYCAFAFAQIKHLHVMSFTDAFTPLHTPRLTILVVQESDLLALLSLQ